jgi:hypothetical protein
VVDQIDMDAEAPPNNVADFNSRALRKGRKPRPRPALPDWAERCIKDEMGRIIPNLANVLAALRALPELVDAFAYDEMSRTAILRRNFRSLQAVRAPASRHSLGPFVMRM